MKPKVSIITVTFNCRENLIKTLKSLHSQGFNDWEHIIIDGQSTDGTVEVIKENESLITYWITEKDNGIYDAMNKGLKVSKGDYVVFLNAGDTFYDESTLDKIPFKEFPDAEIFYGDAMILDQDGKSLGLRHKKLPYDLSWKHFKRGMVVCHQSIFVKREIAPFYDLNYKYTADIDWVMKSLKVSRQIVFTNTIISNFTQDGFSKQNQIRSWLDRYRILKKHFGTYQCILTHIVFIFENIFLLLRIIPEFRKIKS